LVVGIVAGAVVVVVVSAIALAALLGGDDEASGSQPTTTAASETGQANSSPPEPTTPGLASVGGSIELVTGADPVTYEAGEIPFTGTADLTGVDWAEVGFILSADGASIHSVTLLLDGGRLPAEFDFDVLIRQYLDEYEVLEGRVTAVMVEAGTVLELSLDGEAATGVLTFSDDLEVYGTNETRTLDLGSGQVYLTAAISKR
jgi:hypothetical protein